jgi:hypothetical protein
MSKAKSKTKAESKKKVLKYPDWRSKIDLLGTDEFLNVSQYILTHVLNMFNRMKLKCMKNVMKESKMNININNKNDKEKVESSKKELELQAHQLIVSNLVHPYSPISRFAIIYPTGLGKTIAMISVLDNFYNDDRPKILIFPNSQLVQNFYGELMKIPNKYRDYALFKMKNSDGKVDSSDIQRVRDILSMKGDIHHMGQEGYLKAPMRAISFISAGGAPIFHDPPSNPLFRIQYDGKNPYSNKIVIFDEFQNLFYPPPETPKHFLSKLKDFTQAIINSENTVFLAATATPFVEKIEDFQMMLDVVKGSTYKKVGNQGFYSMIPCNPTPVFAKVLSGNPRKFFPTVIRVPLQGLNLKIYQQKVREFKDITSTASILKLTNYCTMGAYASSYSRNKDFMSLLKKNPKSAASKMAQVVDDMKGFKDKTTILIHRRNGYKAFKHFLEMQGIEEYSEKNTNKNSLKFIALFDKFPEGSKEEKRQTQLLNIYNSVENRKGDIIKYVLLDSKFFSEGISIKNDRRLMLVDIPEKWSDFVQRIGRVLRLCGHQDLPKDEWNVEIRVYCSIIPQPGENIHQGSNTSSQPEQDIQFENVFEDYKEWLKKYQEKNKQLPEKKTERVFEKIINLENKNNNMIEKRLRITEAFNLKNMFMKNSVSYERNNKKRAVKPKNKIIDTSKKTNNAGKRNNKKRAVKPKNKIIDPSKKTNNAGKRNNKKRAVKPKNKIIDPSKKTNNAGKRKVREMYTGQTADEMLLEKIQNDGKILEEAFENIAKQSIDYKLLKHFCDDDPKPPERIELIKEKSRIEEKKSVELDANSDISLNIYGDKAIIKGGNVLGWLYTLTDDPFFGVFNSESGEVEIETKHVPKFKSMFSGLLKQKADSKEIIIKGLKLRRVGPNAYIYGSVHTYRDVIHKAIPNRFYNQKFGIFMFPAEFMERVEKSINNYIKIKEEYYQGLKDYQDAETESDDDTDIISNHDSDDDTEILSNNDSDDENIYSYNPNNPAGFAPIVYE